MARPVRMCIIEVRQKCPNGHRVGDEWLVDGRTPGGQQSGCGAGATD